MITWDEEQRCRQRRPRTNGRLLENVASVEIMREGFVGVNWARSLALMNVERADLLL